MPSHHEKVEKIELFFDLVFVFTFIQLTLKLEHHLSVHTFLEVLVLMALIWYIFEGYIWLTNTTKLTRRNHQIFMTLGMIGFMLISVAIPKAYDQDGFIFGLGFLVIVAVHSTLFLLHSNEDTKKAMLVIVPYNVSFSIIILVASLFEGNVRLIVWGIVAIVAVLGPLVQKNRGQFEVSSWHFLERHYLILVIALGETIASTGRAAIDEDLTSDVVLTMILALMLTVLLWYSYVKDDEARENRFQNMHTDRRDQTAKAGFYWSHLSMFLGIILLAVVKITLVHDPMQTLDLAHRITLYVAIVLFGYGVIYFNRLFFKVSWKRLAVLAVLLVIPLIAPYLPATLLLLVIALIYFIAMIAPLPFLKTKQKET
ncbi:low temperature requirement protein A [Exiguobacterium sp. B2(2022)]|uniref:low temperature requirement protein A n=1 Tax=Exiguobacterium sp. B2(2022) TaxID=2992755 RepID=UPI00237A2E2F|nr:low temperature requirement protein A [Exiguobacterium sp. B2(2022)]MDE0563172.1 low temperature requirement protein A [Exiguobacterium sp. B2(2022)]